MAHQLIPQILLGESQNSKVYRAYDVLNDRVVAIKLQPIGRNSQMENDVALAVQTSKYFPKFYGSFISNKATSVSVFQLMGSDLYHLQHQNETHHRLSVATIARLMVQIIDATQHIHEKGFLHQDIKPQNVLMGNDPCNKDTAYLIDYNLCKRYVDEYGKFLESAGTSRKFVGTVRYASPNAHCYHQTMSRRDDMYSIFYMMYEMFVGALPWEPFETNEKLVGSMKCGTYSPESLCDDLPPQMYNFVCHLRNLDFTEKPDYNYFKRMMRDMAKENFVDINLPFDWQVENKSNLFYWPPRPKGDDN